MAICRTHLPRGVASSPWAPPFGSSLGLHCCRLSSADWPRWPKSGRRLKRPNSVAILRRPMCLHHAMFDEPPIKRAARQHPGIKEAAAMLPPQRMTVRRQPVALQAVLRNCAENESKCFGVGWVWIRPPQARSHRLPPRRRFLRSWSPSRRHQPEPQGPRGSVRHLDHLDHQDHQDHQIQDHPNRIPPPPAGRDLNHASRSLNGVRLLIASVARKRSRVVLSSNLRRRPSRRCHHREWLDRPVEIRGQPVGRRLLWPAGSETAGVFSKQS